VSRLVTSAAEFGIPAKFTRVSVKSSIANLFTCFFFFTGPSCGCVYERRKKNERHPLEVVLRKSAPFLDSPDTRNYNVLAPGLGCDVM
jgi:hypothetical protein